VEEVVRGRMRRADRVRLRGWLLLRAASRDIVGSRDKPVMVVRPVMVLHRPDLAQRVGLEPDAPELVAAERFLERRGYVRPVSAGAEPRAFVITEAGERWLESDRWEHPWWRRLLAAALKHILLQLEAPRETPGGLETAAEISESAATREAGQKGSHKRPWWRRVFGG
jgi:hypothetical protein